MSVRQFTDYRTFLLAHSQDMKKQNVRWTYGNWARRLGLKTTSSITKIIQGDRDPGDGITERLIEYFRFKEKDAQYFRDLVRLHKIKKDPRLAVLLLEKMGKDHPNSTEKLLDHQTFSVISNWYHLALREMVRMNEFFEDPYWISKKLKFKVTPRDISSALDALVSLRLLERDPTGKLRVAEGRLNTSNDITSEAIRRYHEQMLENAKIALRKVDVEHREITASSLVIRSENLPKAKQLIRDFKRQFSRLLEEEGGDFVYQIQIQFFPLTNEDRESRPSLGGAVSAARSSKSSES